MTVGTTFYVPYTKIDFKPVVNTVEILGRTPVIGLMVACGILYILFVAWAWREDIKDQYKVSLIFKSMERKQFLLSDAIV
jgi:uncharacterized protein involved in tolerance to divalent cations